MYRVLLGFLLLEVCFCNVSADSSSDYWKALRRPLSSDNQQARRYVRDLTSQKKFREKGNYVTSVVFVDFPTLSDSIDVGDVLDHTDKFDIQYNHVKFSNLSKIYSVGYRIDLTANVVQIILRLGQAQIKGTYSVTTPSSPSSGSQDFELNLYAELSYTHEIPFQIDDKGEANFEKPENQQLSYKKVKGNYVNPPSALASDLKNYLNPNLFKAVVAKIYDEVHQKIKATDASFHVNSELAYKHRRDIADRLKKAISDSFENVHENVYNVFYNDRTNFNLVFQNYDVKIPSFVLRNIEGYEVGATKISFIGDHVRAKVKFVIPSPIALFRIVYRNKDDPSAKNETLRGEFHLSDLCYELEVIANPETNEVEFRDATVKISDARVAATQGQYEDKRDLIIQQLLPYIRSYFQLNTSSGFTDYVKGLLAEGRIAYDVFK